MVQYEVISTLQPQSLASNVRCGDLLVDVIEWILLENFLKLYCAD